MKDIVTMLVYLYLLVALVVYFHLLETLEQKYPVNTQDFYTVFIILISALMWWQAGIKIWAWYIDRLVIFCRVWWYAKVTLPVRRREWERRYKSSWKEAAKSIVKEEP